MSARETDGGIPARIGVGRLLALTTVAIFLTVILGVATRASGAGLACNANWPLCDGGLLNLFPASMPSFFEWFHRVVAGVTGLLILASAYAVWRATDDRRIRWGVAVGTVLLPVQVLLGRETVVSFVPEILAAHYWTAMGIYGGFTLATVAAWESRFGRRHVLAGLSSAVAFVPAMFLLGPPFVTSYSPPIQALQYAVILLLVAVSLLAAIVGWDAMDAPVRYLLVAMPALLPIVVALARQRIVHPRWVIAVAHETTTSLLFLVILGTILAVRREWGGSPVGGSDTVGGNG